MQLNYNMQVVFAIKKDIEKKGLESGHLQDLADLCILEQRANPDFNRKFWFNVSDYVKKNAINKHISTLQSVYGDIYDKVLLWEAPMLFDSYMLYLEKDREEKERFYLPKKKQLSKIGVIQALQDLEDDKLDMLAISLPPGTGKAQPLYSKVLTPNGFITMGEVKAGTKVISGTGNVCNVIGVYPQGVMPIYEITLENGYKCRCTANHLWNVRYNYFGNKCKEKTVELKEIMWQPHKYLIPVTNKELNGIYYLRVGAIQKVDDAECRCIYIDDDSHLYITDNYIITHNTTIEKFFCSWIIGRHPDDYSLFFSHSGDITEMFYKGVLDITTNDMEYRFSEIFPNVKLQSTNAKAETINFGKYKPFANIQCTSVGSKNAGKVRCNRYLYCDDLIGGIEEALNKNILDKLWRVYSTDARQRKLNEQVKEIHIATRWSVHDVIGRLQLAYIGNDRAKFLAVPDIDPETGESNFNYQFNGMSVEFFHDQELLMDDVSYKCLYKNEPIEREGLLYTEDEVERYTELPDGEPEEITGQCDHKGKGIDFMFMFCAKKHGEWYYIDDCVCNRNPDYEIQYESLTNLIVDNKMQNAEFESNMGGDRVALEVSKRVSEKGWICNISDKATESNKEARIFQCANWIKQHCKFKDKSLYSPKSDYATMMGQLFSYSVSGKNANDDIPDCLSLFALRKQALSRVAKAQACINPYRKMY